MTLANCFGTYDIRGQFGSEINQEAAYRISRATAEHLLAKSIVVGFDARETSQELSRAAMLGITEAGVDVINIGLAGTEEMYWAVNQLKSCAGITITASHNPKNYNGFKIVKSGSRPLNFDSDLSIIKRKIEKVSQTAVDKCGTYFDYSQQARLVYVDKVISFVNPNNLKPLKIVINPRNGTAGPTLEAIACRIKALGAPLQFFYVNHEPNFNLNFDKIDLLTPDKDILMAKKINEVDADFGVSFDCDFDRCMFFDENGTFVSNEYIIGLLAKFFLVKEKGAKIVNDHRIFWNIQDIVASLDGVLCLSEVGHTNFKRAMRKSSAIYGAENSGHHYFRDFANCDSGMIPWLLVSEILSYSDQPLSSLVSPNLSKFPSSGEINFIIKNPDQVISVVMKKLADQALKYDITDGLSMEFENWRFNLRQSKTERVMRLYVEARNASKLLASGIACISDLIYKTKI